MKTTNNSKAPQRSARHNHPLAELLMQIAASLAWNAC